MDTRCAVWVVWLAAGCTPQATGFDALPELGIYSVAIEPVEEGCQGTVAAIASTAERVAIEAHADGSYAELYVQANPVLADEDETEEDDDTSAGDLALGRMDNEAFYARQERGPSECDARRVGEFIAVVGDSIEVTASTRWTGVASCEGVATVGWSLPTADCDTTEIYDFVLVEECEEPCSLSREPRVVRGVRRNQPVCSCPDADTDPVETSG